MATHQNNEKVGKAGSEQWNRYRDLRGHNERRARLGKDVDPRLASFVLAIDKIAVSYQDLGIFP